jgi:hypothetical protein
MATYKDLLALPADIHAEVADHGPLLVEEDRKMR